MTERRGRRIFLILATLTILGKLGGTVPTLFRHGDRVDRLLAIVLGLSVPFLWRGTLELQRLVGGTYVLSGARRLFGAGYALALGDDLDNELFFGAILGLVDVLAGLAFLFLPDLVAFFRSQREPQAPADRKSACLPGRHQFRSACAWGLALGCGSGLWIAARNVPLHFGLAPSESAIALLIGGGLGGVLGGFAGVLVATARPDASLTLNRLAVRRGLRAAGATVVAGIVLSAIHGFFFATASSDIPIPLGWPSAGVEALIFAVVGTPVFGTAAFVLGAAIALLLCEPEGKAAAVDWSE